MATCSVPSLFINNLYYSGMISKPGYYIYNNYLNEVTRLVNEYNRNKTDARDMFMVYYDSSNNTYKLLLPKNYTKEHKEISFLGSQIPNVYIRNEIVDKYRFNKFRKMILEEIQQEIKDIEEYMKTLSKYSDKYKELAAKRKELTRIINLKDVSSLMNAYLGGKTKLIDLVKNDIHVATELYKTGNIKALHSARKIVEFYMRAFNSSNEHSKKFISENIFNPENIQITSSEEMFLIKVNGILEDIHEMIREKLKRIAIDITERTLDEKITLEDITKPVKDISIVDEYLSHPTSNILTDAHKLVKLMYEILIDFIEKSLSYAKSVDKKLDEIQNEVERILIKKGHGIEIAGIKGVKYDMFRSVDENGLYENRIITKFTTKFYNAVDKAFKKTKFYYNDTKKVKVNKFKDRILWLSENTEIIDIRKIPELNDPKLSYIHKYLASPNEAQAYKRYFINKYGEYLWNKVVEEQRKKIEAWIEWEKLSKSVISQDILDKENPFLFVERYFDGGLDKYNHDYLPSMKYNHFVPRKHYAKITITKGKITAVETNKQTGYYDKRFEEIEKEPALVKFHDILVDVTKKIYTMMPYDLKENFTPFSFPLLEKSALEILLDDEAQFIGKLSKNAKQSIKDVLKQFVDMKQRIAINDKTSVSKRDIKSVMQPVNLEYGILKVKLKRLYNYDIETAKGLYNAPDMLIRELAQILGVDRNIQALQKRLPNVNFNNVSVKTIVKKALIDKYIREHSFDLIRIAKYYSHILSIYKAKKEASHIIEPLFEIYKKIPNAKRLGEIRKHAVAQLEDWIDRIVLNRNEPKNEIKGMFDRLETITKGAIKSSLLNMLSYKVYNKEERRIKKEIDEAIKYLKEEYKKAKNINDKRDILSQIEMLRSKRAYIGKRITITSLAEGLFNSVRWMKLAWNIPSNIINLVEGQISNLIAAASGRYFSPESYFKAINIMGGSIMRYSTLNKYGTPEAKKARILIDMYDVLQDATNELQKASVKSAYSKLAITNSFHFTNAAEFLNQSPMFLAILMDTKIEDIHGNKHSLWDAYDDDGKLKPQFRTDENIENWEKLKGDKYVALKRKIIKTIVDNHGDYHDLRGNKITKYMIGKMFLMFKRWMQSYVRTRWMRDQFDRDLGKKVKGRYWSITPTQGAILGGLVAITTSPLGFLVGSMLGVGFSYTFGIGRQINLLKDILYNTKAILVNSIAFPVNIVAGREVIKVASAKGIFKNLDEVDIENLQGNIADIIVMVTAIGLHALSMSMAYDDDNEDEELSGWRYIANMTAQILENTATFMNPLLFAETISNSAMFHFLTEVDKLVTETEIQMNRSKTNWEKIWNRFEKAFMPISFRKYFGFETRLKYVFRNLPIDVDIIGKEKYANDKIRYINYLLWDYLRYEKKLKNFEIREIMRDIMPYRREEETAKEYIYDRVRRDRLPEKPRKELDKLIEYLR